jgi:hypothetical protein
VLVLPDPIIVVSGLPRSGTSMVMGMIAAGGVTCVSDGVRTADKDNPRGYFEDERVKKIAASDNRAWLGEARGKAIKVVSPLLKDLPAENDYKVLFVRRDLREVLASQKKMMDRRGEDHDQPEEVMEEMFNKHLTTLDAMLRTRSEIELMYLDHREIIGDPRGQAGRICEFLGQSLDIEGMAAAVDRGLYRNRAS